MGADYVNHICAFFFCILPPRGRCALESALVKSNLARFLTGPESEGVICVFLLEDRRFLPMNRATPT